MSDPDFPMPDTPLEDFLGDVENIDTPADTGMFRDVRVEDSSEAPFDEATTVIGDGACIVCGDPVFRPPGLTAAGHRKRVPKYCDLHVPRAAGARDAPPAARMESQLRRVQEELSDDLRLLATLTGPLFPVTGMYVFDHADPFTVAVLKLAKNNQRFLRVLHRAAQVAPVYTIAETVAGTAYSFQVDQKKADPYSTAARRLGVSRAYDSVYSQSAPGMDNQVTNNGPSAPPRYATVQ